MTAWSTDLIVLACDLVMQDQTPTLPLPGHIPKPLFLVMLAL